MQQTPKPKRDDVERLFADRTFKPQWQIAKEARELKSLDEAMTVGIEFNYRKAAYEKLSAIARKHRR